MSKSTTAEKQGRNHQMDLLRICFAALVLLSHATQLTDGNVSRELFARLTHSDLTSGTVGVDGFFLLSGFLIVQSWQRRPEMVHFLSNRLLRIVPGYLVAVVVSTLVAGLVAPGVPHFFHRLGGHFVHSVLMLGAPVTPPVYGVDPALALVNGSMWSIHYEFLCYFLVALFGVAGLLRRRWAWLAATLLLLVVFLTPYLQMVLAWHHLLTVTGDPSFIFGMVPIYFVGGSFYLFREHIRFRWWMALLALLALVALGLLHAFLHAGLIVFGGYLLFLFSSLRLPGLGWMKGFPDVSYGMYLYGWPVEMLLIRFFHPSPWLVFLTSLVICFGLGWLSWHFIERPMLKLKRHTAPLPAP